MKKILLTIASFLFITILFTSCEKETLVSNDVDSVNFLRIETVSVGGDTTYSDVILVR